MRLQWGQVRRRLLGHKVKERAGTKPFPVGMKWEVTGGLAQRSDNLAQEWTRHFLNVNYYQCHSGRNLTNWFFDRAWQREKMHQGICTHGHWGPAASERSPPDKGPGRGLPRADGEQSEEIIPFASGATLWGSRGAVRGGLSEPQGTYGN